MKHKITALFALLLLLLSYAAVWAYKHKHRERLFYDQAFKQMQSGGDSMPMITIELDDGSSASVILEHSCCSGAGFNAVAVRTSDGEEYVSKKNYCGLQGFHLGVFAETTKDLASFKAFLANEGCTPLRP